MSSLRVRERVLRYLSAHGREQPTVREIAEAVGCARTYVYLFLSGEYARPARRDIRGELKRFVESHPEALLTKARGGLSFKDIAARLRTTSPTISRLWSQLNLPDRTQLKLSDAERSHRSYERRKDLHKASVLAWKSANPEQARAIQRAAQARWQRMVIGRERCSVCGSTFPWTNGHERRRRRLRRPTVCSLHCAMIAWHRK